MILSDVRLGHPNDTTLEGVARGDAGSRASVRRHLERCQECRNHVAFLRSLPSAIATLDGPEAGSALKARIRERVENGERGILPVDDSTGRRRRIPLWAIAASVAIVAAIWAAWPAQDMMAGAVSGDLRFTPGTLRRGAMIKVEYHDPGIFGGAESLVLRARYRTASDESYNDNMPQVTVTTLVRDTRGIYQGQFRSPDSAVFAAFAVEDPEGQHIDSNQRALWHLFQRADGKETFDALTQLSNDQFGGDPSAALSALEKRAELYPDDPEAWAGLLGLQRFALGQAYADSQVPANLDRLLSFHESYGGRSNVPMHVADGIRHLAIQLPTRGHREVGEISQFWYKYSRAQTGSMTDRMFRSMNEINDIARKEPRTKRSQQLAVDSAERLWQAGDSVVRKLASNILNYAFGAGDAAAEIRWTDRVVRSAPHWTAIWYGRLAESPEPDARDSGIQRLRQLLRLLQTRRDERRPLDITVEAQARADSATARLALATLGSALISGGHLAEGLDSLEKATSAGWDLAVFRKVSETFLAVGDTARALHYLSLIAVDPTPNSGTEQRAFAVGGARLTAETWRAILDSARTDMRARLQAASVSRRLARSPRVATRDGAELRLSSIAKGRVSVVVFWSIHCGFALAQLPKIAELSQQFADNGVAMIVVSKEAPSKESDAYLKKAGIKTPVYYDARREAGRAFHNWSTPDFYVVDSSGRIRFEREYDTNDVLAKAVAMQEGGK